MVDRTLYLHSNSLSGTIPSALGLSGSLGTVWLGHNPLTGTIPIEVITLFRRQVFRLVLCDTDLEGVVPGPLVVPPSPSQ